MSNVVTIEHEPLEPARSTAMTPLDMLNRAVETGANIEVMERLMALHERYEAAQSRKAFDAAIADAKAEIAPVVKNRPGHTGKYATFDAIARAVDPIMSKHGLSYRFRTAQTDRIMVTCILSHRAGHSEETTLAGPPDTSGSKNAIQAIGSTLSYLQRYSLIQAMGLATTNDDDGRAAGASKDDGPISDDQYAQLQKLLTESGANVAAFLTVYQVASLSDLYSSQFDSAKKALETKIAKKGASQ